MEVSKKHKALLKQLKAQMRKVAKDLEQKLAEGFATKKREFAIALAKIERKHAAQLIKSVAATRPKPAKKRRAKRK
jgi:hypothetical protein